MNASIRLCELSELPDDSARGFDPDGAGHDTMFVVRRGDRFYAYRDACPHWDGTPLAWRKDAYLSGDRQHIVCSAHGARFDIETGVCLLGPCLGQSLAPLTLAVADGGIYLVPSSEAETLS